MYIRSSSEYQRYLRSKHWQRIRKAFWDHHPLECQCCGQPGTVSKLDVHHRSYEHLGRETWDDLVGLCRLCHESVHTLVRNGQAELMAAHQQIANEHGRPFKRGTQYQSDSFGKSYEDGVPIFIEGESYTSGELERMATCWLVTHPMPGGPQVLLTREQWLTRTRTEIYVGDGWPDPAYTRDRFGNHIRGMYWRTHPNGRSFTSYQYRQAHGSSFYGSHQALPGEIVATPVITSNEPVQCAFPSCSNQAATRNLCGGHYQQTRRGETLRPLRKVFSEAERRVASARAKKSATHTTNRRGSLK